MRKRWIILTFIFVMALSTVLSGCGMKKQTVNSEKYLQDVSTLSIPEGVKIVGIGEATHGNKEFVQLKQDVFKILVEKYGYKAFVLEGDFGGCQVVNDYILWGNGSPEDAVKAIGFDIYKTTEMVDLVKWMNEYNMSVTDQEKLRFYGFDMQRYDNNKDRLFSYIKNVDTEKYSSYQVLLEDLNDETIFDQTNEKIQKGIASIVTIMSEMEKNKSSYISKSTPLEYNLAYQYALCIKENATLRGTDVNYNETRDKYMAQKVQWILEYEKNKGSDKLYLAGHNGHIEKTSASAAYSMSMGQRLSETFKSEYFAIGTEFYENTFLSKAIGSGERKEFTLKNDKSDLIKLFKRTNREIQLLDIQQALKDNRLSTIVKSEQKMGNVGDEFSELTKFLSFSYTIKMVPAEAYDAIVFVRSATPTTMLK